ncbi:MAG: hypothetical protein EB078_11750 [Proteobacteria bacterium]|nr:hypothetical protein [Pseudomonadota bacterium]NDD05573.1 hypothetical protein [Pseudomonadota bacterium]
MASIAALIIGVFSVITNPFSLNVNGSVWKCGTPEWGSNPVVEGGIMKGTIHSVCSFSADKTSYERLKRHVENEVFAESYKVLYGPVEDVYEGLSGSRYDVLVKNEHKGVDAEIRGHFHIVADDRKLIAQFHTDGVVGGAAKGLLEKSDIGYTVTTTRGNYTVLITSTCHVRVSNEKDVSTLKSEMETELKQAENNIIPDIIDHFM